MSSEHWKRRTRRREGMKMRNNGQKRGSLEALKAGMPAALSVILAGREQHYVELSHSLVPEPVYGTGVVYSTYPCTIPSASLLAAVSPCASYPAHSSRRPRSGSLIRAFMKKSPLRFRERNHSTILHQLSLLLNLLFCISVKEVKHAEVL